MANLMLFAGSAHKELAEKISSHLKLKIGKTEIRRFKDGEIYVRFIDSVRGKDIFILQPLCNPVNENWVELLLMVDAARRASAGRINVVIPYYGYARQDRTSLPREPISAKVVADTLNVAGADRLISVDLHSPQIEGFYNFPVDHLRAFNVFLPYLKKKKIKNMVVASPDAGGAKYAKLYAKELNCGMAVMSKHRTKKGEPKTTHLVGDVKNKNVLIVDDLISTGGTIVNAIDLLKKEGAKDVYVVATHGVFSENGDKKILSAKIKELIVTDTIPQKKLSKKFKVLSISKLLADAIKSVNIEKALTE